MIEQSLTDLEYPHEVQSNAKSGMGLENVAILTWEQSESLASCLRVKQAELFDYETFNNDYYELYGKNFIQDWEHPPVVSYKKGLEGREWVMDKMRHIVPKFSGQQSMAAMKVS